jgi:hypothetical protein
MRATFRFNLGEPYEVNSELSHQKHDAALMFRQLRAESNETTGKK